MAVLLYCFFWQDIALGCLAVDGLGSVLSALCLMLTMGPIVGWL